MLHHLKPQGLNSGLKISSQKSEPEAAAAEIMQHLMIAHQTTKDELSLVKDGLGIWSVKLNNMSHDFCLGRCGYCGRMKSLTHTNQEP